MQVTSLNISYRKLNFTEILEGPDHLNITGGFYSATTEDVADYGYDNMSIWDFDNLVMSPEIYDNDPTSKFVAFFNEQNSNLTEIETLSDDDQVYVAISMGLVIDPILFAVAFVYILSQAFGATFGHNLNSSTITSITERTIIYDLLIDFSIDDSGHWQNMTYNGNLNLTYGKTSNILMKSICTATVDATEWNGTHYVTETIRGRNTHEIKYPTELVSDYPTPDPDPDPVPKIPGFPVSLLISAMVLGIIPAYLIVKRKKK